MINRLGNVFGVSFTKNVGDITDCCSSATKLGQMIVRNVIGMMPYAGDVVCGLTAAGITEALGWALVEEYALMAHSGESFSVARVAKTIDKMLPKVESLLK